VAGFEPTPRAMLTTLGDGDALAVADAGGLVLGEPLAVAGVVGVAAAEVVAGGVLAEDVFDRGKSA
jgi:hypothetical protein